MRISDWSSDVCSSDLEDAIEPIGLLAEARHRIFETLGRVEQEMAILAEPRSEPADLPHQPLVSLYPAAHILRQEHEIGRASCMESVGQYVSISVFAVTLKKKNNKRKRYILSHL